MQSVVPGISQKRILAGGLERHWGSVASIMFILLARNKRDNLQRTPASQCMSLSMASIISNQAGQCSGLSLWYEKLFLMKERKKDYEYLRMIKDRCRLCNSVET